MGKKYITEIIGNEFCYWEKKKIFLQAPTGSGKSTFILQNLLNHYRRKRWKLLILCNRRLLRKQYWYQLVQQFESLSELQQTVEIKTYQELASILMHETTLDKAFHGYAGICLDEVHYFYADSDFNAFGTYVLFQAIMRSGINRQMIFLSATIDCIKPYILKAIRLLQIESYQKPEEDDCPINRSEIFESVSYPMPQNTYTGIKCFCVPDLEALCMQIAKSPSKSIVFMDNKAEAGKMVDILVTKRGIKNSDVVRLSAEDMEKAECNPTINALVMANKVLPKILLTTSVLDNGVSIQDSEVENVAIITESQISFLQMLGRVRQESAKGFNLYFVLRPASYFARREQELKRLMDAFDKFANRNLYRFRYEILTELWNNSSELADLYRKIIVPEPEALELLGKTNQLIRISYGDTMLTVNLFSKEKSGDMYLTVARFRQAAELDPVRVVYEQMRWIGKTPEELEMLDGIAEEQRREFLGIVMKIRNFTKEQMQETKEMIAEKFGKNYLSKYELRNRSFSLEKLSEILAEEGLNIRKQVISGKTIYNIEKARIGGE